MSDNKTLEIPEKVTIKFQDSKVRMREKTNGAGEMRKMKMYFDFTKEEAETFKNLAQVLKPEHETLNNFIRVLVLMGIEAYISKLKVEKEKFDAEHPELQPTVPLQDVSSIPNVEVL